MKSIQSKEEHMG